ncbi:hypothetical protein GH733_015152, partial [Mirounga leonina]
FSDGDFSEENEGEGESINGGYFEDESFSVKHNRESLLLVTGGRIQKVHSSSKPQNPTSHLDGYHVVLREVNSFQEVVGERKPENRCKEFPPIPENRFLIRKSAPKAGEKERKNREREIEREIYLTSSLLHIRGDFKVQTEKVKRKRKLKTINLTVKRETLEEIQKKDDKYNKNKVKKGAKSKSGRGKLVYGVRL